MLDETVERSLKRAALWEEVKDDFKKKSGLALSGGQQQRLCIARTMATEPDVILMDEPASALDPISTLKIEDLIHELRERYTIVIVTHNMQQASRVSQMTAFFTLGEDRAGYLVEYSADSPDLHQPKAAIDRGLRLGEVRLMEPDRDDDPGPGRASCSTTSGART